MKTAATTEAMTTAGTRPRIVASTPDLFDEAPVPLGYWPTASSLEGRFLARLLRGAELTAGDWLRDVASMRLAAEAQELRDAGWKVKAERVRVVTRDRGRTAYVARYALDPVQRQAAAASEQGRHFVARVDAAEQLRNSDGGAP